MAPPDPASIELRVGATSDGCAGPCDEVAAGPGDPALARAVARARPGGRVVLYPSSDTFEATALTLCSYESGSSSTPASSSACCA